MPEMSKRDEENNFGLDFILKLKPCSWSWKAPMNDGKTHFGFIAQDVLELAPRSDYGFVTMRESFYAINYHEFFGPFAKAMQELHEINVGLSKRIEHLEKEIRPEMAIQELSKRIDELENKHKVQRKQPAI